MRPAQDSAQMDHGVRVGSAGLLAIPALPHHTSRDVAVGLSCDAVCLSPAGRGISFGQMGNFDPE